MQIVMAESLLSTTWNPDVSTYFYFYRLGVGHDSDSKPNCPDGRFIMAVAAPGGKDAFRWSPCSKADIQGFLR